MSYKSYIVTVYLDIPVAMPTSKSEIFPIHFDGLLTRIMAEEAGSFDYSRLTAKDIELPLEKWGKTKTIYKASSMIIKPPAKVYREPWTGTQTWLDYGRILFPGSFNKQIRNDQGVYKSSAGYLHLIDTPQIYFYFCGDGQAVKHMLEKLIGRGIGVRANAGYGQVRRITIEPSKDYSLIAEDSYPARNIPVDEIEGDIRWPVQRGTYKPPYWDYEEATICYISPRWHWWPVKQPAEVLKEILKHDKKSYTIPEEGEDQ
jgi:CRISPR type IV-associated protein Csf3